MSEMLFRMLVIAVAAIFTVFFCVTVVPPLFENPDIVGAVSAGFVNPYSSGYATDVILCWILLAVWVAYEKHKHSVKSGWFCLLLGVVPGVVVGFAAYLLVRQRHFSAYPESELVN